MSENLHQLVGWLQVQALDHLHSVAGNAPIVQKHAHWLRQCADEVSAMLAERQKETK